MEGAFRSFPAKGSLGSVSEVHVVFSNRQLSSTPGVLPRAISKGCILTLANNSKRTLMSHIRVLPGGLWLLEEAP